MTCSILQSPVSSDIRSWGILVRLVAMCERDGDRTLHISVRALSSESGLPYQQLRTVLRNLESAGEITQKSTRKSTQDSTQDSTQKSTQLLTCITICKYDSYISKKKKSNAETNARINAETNAEINAGLSAVVVDNPKKRYKGFDLSFVDDSVYESFEKFLRMRDAIKKPLKTAHGIESAYKNLTKLALEESKVSGIAPEDAARMIISQSIDNEWQGLFAIKKQNNGRTTDTIGYVQRTAADLRSMHAADGQGEEAACDLSGMF